MRHRAQVFALRWLQLIDITLTAAAATEHYCTREVKELTALPKGTILNWSRQGRFPKATGITKGTLQYLKSEVDAWCKDNQDLIAVRKERLAQKTLRRSNVNTMINPKHMLNIEQVATLIGVSSGQIYRMIRDGRFPAANLAGGGTKGNHSLWHKHVVDSYIKAQNTRSMENPLEFSVDEIRQLRTAAKAVYTDLDFFIKEAALWKAKVILDRL